MKIKINLFLVSSFIITLAVVFSSLMLLVQMRTEALQLATMGQEQAIRTFWQLLLAKGNEFRVVDGRMLAGDYVVNGNYELPDKIKEIFGGTATIFQGDIRVSTNVLNQAGTRAIGTRLTGPAYDAIFRENRSYRGEAPILGIPYFTAYDPIHDRHGKIIGVLHVGIKKGVFFEAYARLKSNVIAGAFLLEFLLIALAWGLFRERVRAEAGLREMADRIRLITDSVPVGISYVDTKMRYLFANRRYEQLFGLEGGEKLVGRMVREVVGDVFFTTRGDNIRQALAGNEVLFTHALPRSDGSTLILQTAYIPHWGEGEKVLGYFIQHYDITDLTLAQEALRISEERYRTLFDTTGTATFVSEDDTTVSLVNEGFIRLCGRARKEVEGRLSWTAFVTPASRERMLTYHRARRLDPTSAPCTYECEIIGHDGSLRNILAHVNLIPGTKRSIASFLDITRHKQLEASLQGQLTFLQTLIDTIPSPVFYKDRGGRYTGCNFAFEKYLGRAREEVVGRTVYDLAPPELADRYHERDEALFADPGVQVYDSSVVYADGSRHDVIFNKATFTGKDGDVAGLVGVILDVTERNKIEDAFAEREEFLSNVLDSIQDGISILDEELRITRLNSVLEARFADGTSLLGRKCHEVYHGRTAPCESCPSLETLQSGKPAFKIFSIVKNARKRWLELHTFPLFDAKQSRIIGVIEHTRDITDAKRAEDALLESEERFHQIFVQNGDAIIIVRVDTFIIIDANPAAEELTGYSREELQKLALTTFIEPEDFRRLMDTILLDDCSRAFQLDRATGARKDGSAVAVAIRCKILRLREEHVIHCSIRDIAEKVRLEEEVKDTQAKLIHTNKMTSIGMLASSVAHEINNPNNCISVNASMLADVWHDAEPFLENVRAEHGDFSLRGIPFSKMREFAPRLLNGITEGSRRIAAIVHNMRDYVREDKSGLHGAVDVNRLIQNASSILWHHIHVYTDNFHTELEETLPLARGNSQQIEQVVINLITNALQALSDKKGRVFVATVGDRDAGTVSIYVRDEGRGMDGEVMARLKEPFFTTKLAEGGTGLGLYISDSILKEHKGSLQFESVPGLGTTATVILPMAGAPA